MCEEFIVFLHYLSTIKMAAHNDLGKWGEEEACKYLEALGYTIVARDWKDGHRDLDIVALDDHDVLVVVEVKTRRQDTLTDPVTAVDWKKIRSLSIAASKFVKTHRMGAEIRFDIIGVTPTNEGCNINHIKEAFLPNL